MYSSDVLSIWNSFGLYWLTPIKADEEMLIVYHLFQTSEDGCKENKRMEEKNRQMKKVSFDGYVASGT